MKRFIALFLSMLMVLSVMLSAVSCNELFEDLLADPDADLEEDYTDRPGSEKTTSKRPEKTTEEGTEPYSEKLPEYTVPPVEFPTEWPSEWPTEWPTEWPSEWNTSEPDCKHRDKEPADHFCDICGAYMDCYDNDRDHFCDVCGNVITDCYDNDRDHFCDLCLSRMSVCFDKKPVDHHCDVCGIVMIKECYDKDDDHFCDVCGNVITDCYDNNSDCCCDACGATIEFPGLMATGSGMMSDDEYRENGKSMVFGEANAWFSANRGAEGASGVDTISFFGWAMYGDGKEVAVVDFGYGLLKNRTEMSEITWGFAPIVDEYLFAPLGGAVEVRRYDITIDLTGLETAEYDVYLYVKFANDEVYILDAWKDVWVNHVNEFMSESASATAQSDIDEGYEGSVLSESGLPFYVLTEGAGIIAGEGGLITTGKNGNPVWKFRSNFGEFHKTATGKYQYTIGFNYGRDASGGGFVRGSYKGFDGWDPGYWGAAGDGTITQTVAHGKAGIYYYVDTANSELVLVIKSHNAKNFLIPDITTIKIPVESWDITVIDLGDVIYFKAGESTVAKVDLIGSKYYEQIEAAMVDKLDITTWNGEYLTIYDAYVCSELVGSHFGISTRIAEMEITSIGYSSAAGVAYNPNLDVATSVSTDKAVYTEGDFINVSASYRDFAYVCIYDRATWDLIDYYEIGTKNGFENIPAGDYSIALADEKVEALLVVDITVKPGSVVASYGADDLVVRVNDPFGATFGCVPSLSEDGKYVTLTMDPEAYHSGLQGPNGTDYNWYFGWAYPGYEVTASNYMVIKYRTSATNIDKNEMFIGTNAIQFGGSGSNIKFDLVNDGEWHYLYINFEELGIKDMNELYALRLDLLNGAPKGSAIDIEFINFYKTHEDANAVVNAPVSIDL